MATFNAGSIEASLTLDRSSWNVELREVQAEIERLEQTTVTISIDADTDNFFVQANNVELMGESLAQDDIVVGVDMDADKFHRGAAEVESVVDIMKEQDINIGVDADGTAEVLAELAELETAIEIVDGNDINIDVNYDRNAMESLVGNAAGGGGGGGGSMGLLKILILAIIALSPILGVAIGAAGAAIVGFTAALVGALGPAALLAGALIILIKQFKATDPSQYTPGMRELADELGKLHDAVQNLISTRVGEIFFKAMATGVGAGIDVLKAIRPLMEPVANLFRDIADAVADFVNSPEFAGWIDFFGGFGIRMLRDFLSIGGNLLRFLMDLFIAISPFAGRMMQGLTDAVRDLAIWSEHIGQTKGFQDWIGDALHYGPMLLDLLADIFGAFFHIGDAIRPFAEPMIQGLDAIADAIQRIPVDVLTQLILAGVGLFAIFHVLIPLFTNIGEALIIASEGAELLAGALGLALGPFILIALAIAGLVGVLVYLWNTNRDFRESVINTWHQIRDAIMPIVHDIVQVFREEWPEIRKTAQDVWKSIQEIVINVMGILQQIIFFATRAIQFIWRHFGDQLVRILRADIGILLGVLRGGFQILAGIFAFINDLIHGRWSRLWGDVKQILRGAWTVISSVVRGGFQIISALFNMAGRVWHGIWSGLWAGIKSLAGSAIGWIRDRVSSIGGFFSGVPGRIAGALSGIVGIITAPFRSALNTIVGWWNGLSLSVDIPNKIPGLPDSFTVSTPNVGGFAKGGYVDEPTLAMVGEGREPEFITPESKMEALVRRVMNERADHSDLTNSLTRALRPLLGEARASDMVAKIDVHAENDDRSVNALVRALGFQMRVLGFEGANA